HRGARLHLLLVVEILGVGLLRRRRFLAAHGAFATIAAAIPTVHSFLAVMPLWTLAPLLHLDRPCAVVPMVFGARQGRANQLAVGEILAFDGGGVCGIHSDFLHSGATLRTRVRADSHSIGPGKCKVRRRENLRLTYHSYFRLTMLPSCHMTS